jgi:flagellar basal body rod protein FlgB
MNNGRVLSFAEGRLNVAARGQRVFSTNTATANGNTVDLESQMIKSTNTGLQYITLIQYLNQKLRALRASMTESGREI